MTTDPRVDDYIARAAPFARPILTELRARIHAACPEVAETIKWGMPAFEYHGPLAGIAAFKAHCACGFWKHDLVLGDQAGAREGMSSFGRLASVADLPGKRRFASWVKTAMRLNEQGVKPVRSTRAPKPPPVPHPEFAAALRRNRKAKATFDAFPPGQQREYVDWIVDAKRDETRQRRIEQAIEWIAAGKRRNWKYER